MTTTANATPPPDDTEAIRRALAADINAEPSERAALEAEYGQVWDPDELRRDFEVLSFSAPLVVARRRSDQRLGSLAFQHHPRFYFAWREDRP
jgi:hypothetical protein